MKNMLLALVILISAVAPAKATTMVASWYAEGHRTASGERFHPDGLTAAHRSLPFGTKLRITYKNHSVVVRINDRGPFIKGRHLDLSRGAARAIRCPGVCKVKTQILN